MPSLLRSILAIVISLPAFAADPASPQPTVVAPNASIQSALDANPNRLVFLPAGDYIALCGDTGVAGS